MWNQICTLAFLGVNSWLDIRKREVSLFTIVIFGAGGLLLALYRGVFSLDYVIPFAIGAGILGLGIATQGAIGMGDGLFLMALGTMMEAGKFIAVFFMGLMACGVSSLIMLLVFHKGRNAELPFIPFVLLGYIGGLILW